MPEKVTNERDGEVKYLLAHEISPHDTPLDIPAKEDNRWKLFIATLLLLCGLALAGVVIFFFFEHFD